MLGGFACSKCMLDSEWRLDHQILYITIAPDGAYKISVDELKSGEALLCFTDPSTRPWHAATAAINVHEVIRAVERSTESLWLVNT